MSDIQRFRTNILVQLKQCPKCGELKPLGDFHNDKNSQDGKTRRCKECNNTASRDRWPIAKLTQKPRNPEVTRARFLRWNINNPERRHHNRLLHRYGQTLDDYYAILEEKGGCGICGTDQPGGRSGLWFQGDHDHDCCKGKVSCGKCFRGFVCHRCNTYVIPVYEGRRKGNIQDLYVEVDAYMTTYNVCRAVEDALDEVFTNA